MSCFFTVLYIECFCFAYWVRLLLRVVSVFLGFDLFLGSSVVSWLRVMFDIDRFEFEFIVGSFSKLFKLF